MLYLNTADILDKAQSFLADTSAPLRAKMLVWLNLAMQSVLNEPRQWNFLQTKTSGITITASKATLPADFGELFNVTLGTEYFFEPENELTAEEAFSVNDLTDTEPFGFVYVTETAVRKIQFIPATTEATCDITYEPVLPLAGYEDVGTDTLFPIEFTNLFVRMVLTNRNEMDVEDQLSFSATFDEKEMRKLKALDNKRQAKPKNNKHGYIRVQA
jgi:hypothetical protein